MTTLMAFVVFFIAIALVFDYINGFHDAANSIATVVSTRVLSPGVAVIWAAFFNFIAFAVFGIDFAFYKHYAVERQVVFRFFPHTREHYYLYIGV